MAVQQHMMYVLTCRALTERWERGRVITYGCANRAGDDGYCARCGAKAVKPRLEHDHSASFRVVRALSGSPSPAIVRRVLLSPLVGNRP